MFSNVELLEKLQANILQAAWDVKAEPQLLLAMEQGLLPDDFIINSNGLFRREYSRDIIAADIREDIVHRELLELRLSRPGLYDQLPEGLFFQSAQRSNRSAGAGDMAADYKYNKKKEEEIRRFFLPFENDFFLQRLQIEQQEAMLLEGLQSGILNDYFIRFWDLPASIPKAFIVPLILLLPYAYKIAGDLALTADCLQQLLQEEVTIHTRASAPVEAPGLSPVMGDGLLGVDLVCGNRFWDGTPLIEIKIGPLQNSLIADYLEAGNRHILMETFTRFFIPAGVDSTLQIEIQPERMNMVLEPFDAPVLGYSTLLEA